MSRLFRNTIFYLLIVLIVVGLISVFSDSSNKREEITIQQFYTQANEGKIESATAQPKNGVYEITGKYKDGDSHFITNATMSEQTAEAFKAVGEKVNIKIIPAKEASILMSLFTGLLPIVLIVILFFFLMNQAQGGGGKVMNFGKSKAKMYADDKNKVRFDDVAGADEEKNELVEIVDFLKDPRKFSELGARIPKGVLLVGPPGTGKTLLARAVAGEAGVPFFSISGSDFVEMFVGVGASRVRDLFENAKKNAPCIIFIDEIDAIAMDRINSRDIREMGRVTSSILKELDNLDARVLFIATTNLYKNLDKALTRRFDAIVNFDRYTREDLLEISEAILNEYLPRFEKAGRDIKLFRKIMNLLTVIPHPGELKNIIRTSLAFSEPNSEFDYLKRLYSAVLVQEKKKELTIKELKDRSFTVRDIEKLTGVPKSNISRKLKEDENE